MSKKYKTQSFKKQKDKQNKSDNTKRQKQQLNTVEERQNNRMAQNWEKSMTRLYGITYLTSMQSTSRKMLGWMNHKMESRLLGEILITLDMQMKPF